MEKKPVDADNPINNFVDLMHLRESGDPEKRYWAQVFDMISEMQISLEAALQRFQALDALRYGETEGATGRRESGRREAGREVGAREEADARRKPAPEIGGLDVARLTSLLTEAAKDLPKSQR
ncbi:MAG: hypothetical protein U5J83_01005 [Bryobacterales bacterium]|nr:hypothetical protein [Bryobacterales bacterium]